jgi:hypothetical protein
VAADASVAGTEPSDALNTSTSSSASNAVCDLTADDVEITLAMSNKIRRTVPLRMPNSTDPAQCFDLLDQMYEIYYTQEVSKI